MSLKQFLGKDGPVGKIKAFSLSIVWKSPLAYRKQSAMAILQTISLSSHLIILLSPIV